MKSTLTILTVLVLAGCDAPGQPVTLELEACEVPERVAVREHVDIWPEEHHWARATCPDDMRLVMGGCMLGGYRGSLVLEASAPDVVQVDGEPTEQDPQTWYCSAYNTSDHLVGVVSAWAVCEELP